MNTAFLGELLANALPGNWVAIAHDNPRVLATGADVATVLATASAAGDADPIVVRVPQAPDSVLVTPSAAADPARSTAGGSQAPAVVPTPLSPPAAPRPIPYDFIAMAAEGGAIVPFLGAGASSLRPSADEPFDTNSQFFPNASELKALLAKTFRYPEHELADSDLAKVSSYVAWLGGRAPLRYMLRQALGPPTGARRRCDPGPIHKFIAGEQKIQLVITTNYDTLIEDAFADIERPYDLLVYPAELPAYGNAAMLLRWKAARPERLDPNSLRSIDGTSQGGLDFSRTIIFKMHGSLWPTPDGDAFVITEEDYLEFLSRMIGRSAIPAPVMDYLSLKSLLFLGYGLRDWNLRLLLRTLNKPDRAWGVQRYVTEVEERLWASRSVEIYDQDLSTFAAELERALQQLRGNR